MYRLDKGLAIYVKVIDKGLAIYVKVKETKGLAIYVKVKETGIKYAKEKQRNFFLKGK